MLKIEISGDTPLEALATITAFGLRCMGNADVYAAANRILEAEQAKKAAANPQPVADLPPEPYVEEPPHGAPTPAPKPEPKPKKEDQREPPTLEEVRAKGLDAARKHGQPAIKAILEGFGVTSMSNLAADDRAAFLAKLAELEGTGEGDA